MISHWFFLVFGALSAIIFFRAAVESILAAFFIEILSGAPVGVVSIPMSLTTIAVEAFRVHMNEYFSIGFVILFLAGLCVFITLHVVIIGIV